MLLPKRDGRLRPLPATLTFLKKGAASQIPLRSTCRCSLTTGISQWPEPKTDSTADSPEFPPKTSSCLPSAPYPFLYVLNSTQLCLLPLIPPSTPSYWWVLPPLAYCGTFSWSPSCTRTPVPVGSTVIFSNAGYLIPLLASLPVSLTSCFVVILCPSAQSPCFIVP